MYNNAIEFNLKKKNNNNTATTIKHKTNKQKKLAKEIGRKMSKSDDSPNRWSISSCKQALVLGQSTAKKNTFAC